MSKAEPMDPEKRPASTPRQQRRYRKKLKGDWGCDLTGEDYVPSYEGLPEAERPKQYRTPRRADARAAMLERRRG